MRKKCTECGQITRSAYALCSAHNPRKKRRAVTDTEAWCSKGRHMVEHAGFAKNQDVCRACRKSAGYNDRSNYSHGKTCKVCGVRVANTNRGGHCRQHHREAVEKQKRKTAPRRYVDKQGYVVITSQWDHPNCDKRGHIKEHTLVLSQKLGRPLAPGENVHHINGVRDDNRPENLELWVTSQPSGQRPEDLVAWAWEIIDRYDRRDGRAGLFVVRHSA